MSDQAAVDHDLYRRTKALLEPGEVELIGCIVHTDLAGDEDLEMQELVVEINEVIADHAPGADRRRRVVRLGESTPAPGRELRSGVLLRGGR
jgi:hypothetical protein